MSKQPPRALLLRRAVLVEGALSWELGNGAAGLAEPHQHLRGANVFGWFTVLGPTLGIWKCALLFNSHVSEADTALMLILLSGLIHVSGWEA